VLQSNPYIIFRNPFISSLSSKNPVDSSYSSSSGIKSNTTNYPVSNIPSQNNSKSFINTYSTPVPKSIDNVINTFKPGSKNSNDVFTSNDSNVHFNNSNPVSLSSPLISHTINSPYSSSNYSSFSVFVPSSSSSVHSSSSTSSFKQSSSSFHYTPTNQVKSQITTSDTIPLFLPLEGLQNRIIELPVFLKERNKDYFDAFNFLEIKKKFLKKDYS
jgi:hypothetical protein